MIFSGWLSLMKILIVQFYFSEHFILQISRFYGSGQALVILS